MKWPSRQTCRRRLLPGGRGRWGRRCAGRGGRSPCFKRASRRRDERMSLAAAAEAAGLAYRHLDLVAPGGPKGVSGCGGASAGAARGAGAGSPGLPGCARLRASGPRLGRGRVPALRFGAGGLSGGAPGRPGCGARAGRGAGVSGRRAGVDRDRFSGKGVDPQAPIWSFARATGFDSGSGWPVGGLQGEGIEVADGLEAAGTARGFAVRRSGGPPAALPHPRVSVCVAHYEHPRFLGRALASLEAQTEPAHEVIVIDDGSESAEARAVFAQAEAQYGPRGWKFLRGANAGPAAARNRAAREATGEAVIFCDADNWFRPGDGRGVFPRAWRRAGPIASPAHLRSCRTGRIPPRRSSEYVYAPLGPCLELGVLENVIGDTNFIIRRAGLRGAWGVSDREPGPERGLGVSPAAGAGGTLAGECPCGPFQLPAYGRKPRPQPERARQRQGRGGAGLRAADAGVAPAVAPCRGNGARPARGPPRSGACRGPRGPRGGGAGLAADGTGSAGRASFSSKMRGRPSLRRFGPARRRRRAGGATTPR